jgi:acyl-CoA thioester hydrolase
MGHMNVLWYTAKFDEASWTFLSLIGIHPGYLRDAGRRMAATRQTISYIKELFAGDAIIISTTLNHIGTKSLRFTHRMYRDTDYDQVAVSELIAVHVDASTRRGCEFSVAVRSKLSPFLEGESGAPHGRGAVDGVA